MQVFDECHKAKNLVPDAGGKPTKVGKQVLELQKKLPNARVVYCSATGASYSQGVRHHECHLRYICCIWCLTIPLYPCAQRLCILLSRKLMLKLCCRRKRTAQPGLHGPVGPVGRGHTCLPAILPISGSSWRPRCRCAGASGHGHESPWHVRLPHALLCRCALPSIPECSSLKKAVFHPGLCNPCSPLSNS